MIRVLIVDDNELIRFGVEQLLKQAGDMVVVGQCADGAEVVAAAKALLPDVVLMDVSMPVVSGLLATRALKVEQPAIRVLILTAFSKTATICAAAESGADGYLRKGGPSSELLDALRTVATGGTVWAAHGGERAES